MAHHNNHNYRDKRYRHQNRNEYCGTIRPENTSLFSFAFSIRFRVWAVFFGFTVGILIFFYVNQVVLLPFHYNYMKTQESVATANLLKKVWDTPELPAEIQRLANDQEMLIRAIVYDSDGGLPEYYEVDPENRFTAQKTGRVTVDENIRDAVLKSPSGMIHSIAQTQAGRQFLVLSAYVGKSQQAVTGYLEIYNYIEPLATTTGIMNSQFYGNAIFLMFVAFLLSAFLSSKMSRPIINIAHSAPKIAEGSFSLRANISDYSEIRILTENLTKASREVEKAEHLRRDLIANVSHDLKTPLTMIKAYAEMIRDLSGNNPEKRDYHLNIIIEEADRLNALVVDMLDLSKLQSGVAALQRTRYDFSEHLQGVLARYTALSEERKYTMITSEVDPGIFISADESKMDQVVYNFLNNAINYTGENGFIKVALFTKKRGVARLEITDNGKGIPKDELPLIWDRYYKANKSENRARPDKGTGLGLSIVKGVLESHGFAFGAISEVDRGSTFWFEFPSN